MIPSPTTSSLCGHLVALAVLSAAIAHNLHLGTALCSECGGGGGSPYTTQCVPLTAHTFTRNVFPCVVLRSNLSTLFHHTCAVCVSVRPSRRVLAVTLR
jgi:hypothetical protein